MMPLLFFFFSFFSGLLITLMLVYKWDPLIFRRQMIYLFLLDFLLLVSSLPSLLLVF